MNTSISEADTSKRRSQAGNTTLINLCTNKKDRGTVDSQHLSPSITVISIFCNTGEVLHTSLQRPKRENICNRIRALICRSQNGVSRTRYTLSVRDSSVAFQTVEKYVQSCADVNGGGASFCISGVDDA